MKSYKIKSITLLLMLTCWFFQSCSDDNALSDDGIVSEDFRGSRGGGNGGGGNGGGGNGGGRNGGDRNNSTPVEALDSEIAEDWIDLLLEVERYSAGRPNASARSFAYIFLATYETAVPGMDGYSSLAEVYSELDIAGAPTRELDYELALNTTFEIVVDHFMINLSTENTEKIETFASENEATLSGGLPSAIITDSQEWGTYVAQQVIAYSQTDAEAEEQIQAPQPSSYEPPTGDGYWTYSADPERALFPYWSSVRTFVISSEETSTVPPMDYSSNRNTPYFAQMQDVYEANNEARAEQGEQLHIAEFWSDDVEGLMMSPPARQVSIANQLIDQYDVNLEDALELLVKLGFSLNDAAVSTWADKYEYMVMRPSNFIHEYIDPDFQTNLYRLVYWPNPSFPGYPSGHSCFASAAAGVFIDAFGNRTNFTDRTHEGRTEFQSAPRNFRSFEDMAEENGYSRIPLGVHIEIDCTEGLRLGYEISDAVNNLSLRNPL